MAQKGEDPMSGLLSNLGGIDSSLFHKPQAMRDQRKLTSPASTHRPQSSAQAESQLSARKHVPSMPSPGVGMTPRQSSFRQAEKDSEADKRLSNMLGESLSLQAQR